MNLAKFSYRPEYAYASSRFVLLIVFVDCFVLRNVLTFELRDMRETFIHTAYLTFLFFRRNYIPKSKASFLVA